MSDIISGKFSGRISGKISGVGSRRVWGTISGGRYRPAAAAQMVVHPQIPHFGGRLQRGARPMSCFCRMRVSPQSTSWLAVSSAFVTNMLRARRNRWFLLHSASPDSTFWWAVSNAFVTNLPCARTQFIDFVYVCPRIHIWAFRLQRIRHKFAPRAHPMCWFCTFAPPDSTFW